MKSIFNKNRQHLQFLATVTLASSISFISGCSLLRVYTIDVPQGTPITQSQAQQLKVGMSKHQVLYVLGSPAFKDTIEANRWDYIYDYEAGTFGKRKRKVNIHNASQHLTIYFSNNQVSRIEGRETLPKNINNNYQ